MSLGNEDRIRRLAHDGNTALLDLAPANQALKDIVAAREHKRPLILLLSACLGNSQTVLYLVMGLRLWEADIIMRSVFEGTVKFAYMVENQATLAERCIEYCDVLPTISQLRWHGKALESLKALGDDGSVSQQPLRDMVLPDEEIQAIRTKYPRDVRQKIEARWGFTELVTALSKPGGAFGPVGRSALHGYMVSSHLAHMSHEGVDMPMERDTREQGRREAITLAHASRLVSDCFELAFLRSACIRRFLDRPVDDLFEIRKRHEPLLRELHDASDEFGKAEYGGVPPP
jgi:hypothetical protein